MCTPPPKILSFHQFQEKQSIFPNQTLDGDTICKNSRYCSSDPSSTICKNCPNIVKKIDAIYRNSNQLSPLTSISGMNTLLGGQYCDTLNTTQQTMKTYQTNVQNADRLIYKNHASIQDLNQKLKTQQNLLATQQEMLTAFLQQNTSLDLQSEETSTDIIDIGIPYVFSFPIKRRNFIMIMLCLSLLLVGCLGVQIYDLIQKKSVNK